VNQVYDNPVQYSSLEVLMAVLLFSFQIYADFYGYSTIALGSARLLGVTIMDNFKTPYLSKSITEFWSRWHISLSTWFRDYLYIPLGGNKVTLPRWTINIMIVFMVSGLWHGASWTFVVWGALHGLMRILEKYFSKIFNFKIHEGWSFLNVLLVIKTFLITSFIWIFFRAESFSKAKLVVKALVKNLHVPAQDLNFSLPLAFAVLMMAFDIYTYNSRFDAKLLQLRSPYRWAFYTCLIFCLCVLSGTRKFTFIYFQF